MEKKMGDGAWSAGGYEIEYDPYDTGDFDVWTGKDRDYKVSEMTSSHIRKCVEICKNLSLSSSFECESMKWDFWVDVFLNELTSRSMMKKPETKSVNSIRSTTPKVKPPVKAFKFLSLIDSESKNQDMICQCGNRYTARVADLKRGWALSCSKSCAAIRRKYKKPEAKLVLKVK